MAPTSGPAAGRRRLPAGPTSGRVRCVLLAGAVLALAAGRVRAQTPPDAAPAGTTLPGPPSTAPPTPGAIGTQSEVVTTQLLAMTADLAGAGVVAGFETAVSEVRRRVATRWLETARLLDTLPRQAALAAFASEWRTLQSETEELRTAIAKHTVRSGGDMRTLTRLRDAWSGTLDHVRGDGTPAPIVAHVEATLGTIDTSRGLFEKENARLLVLQDALSQALETCDDAQVRIQNIRRQAVGQMLRQRTVPVWKLAGIGNAREPARAIDTSAEIRTRLRGLRAYLRAHWLGFVFTAGLALVLAWMLRRPRTVASTASALAAPVSTALMVTIACTRPLRPAPPWLLQQGLLLVLLPAALTILRPAVGAHAERLLYGLALLLLVDAGREMLLANPFAEQGMLIVEMAAATVILTSLARRAPPSGDQFVHITPWVRTAIRRLFWVVALATALASLAAAGGYLDLADFGGGGGLYLAGTAIGVVAVRSALTGVLELALVATPLARLRTVTTHGATLTRIIGRLVDFAALGFWCLTALERFELLVPATAALQAVLAAPLPAGALDISLGRVLGVVALVVVAWLVARVTVAALESDVYPRLALPRGVPYALSTLVRYGVLLAGFLLAVASLGLDLTHLTLLVSALGLGLGFGLQQVINNFVSGLILLFERPVQVGDAVQLGELSGDMLRIGIRSSAIRTPDGAEVIVPNSQLIEQRVTNWTLSDRRRRVAMTLRVAYGTGARPLLALLLAVAHRDPRVLAQPEPEALFIGFADTGLDFELRVWTEDRRWMRLRSDLAVAVQDELTKAHIEGPPPR